MPWWGWFGVAAAVIGIMWAVDTWLLPRPKLRPLILRMFRTSEQPSIGVHVHVDRLLIFAPLNYYDGLPTSPNQPVRNSFQRGVSLRWQGRHDDAVSVFRQALGLQPTAEEKVGLLLLIGNCFVEQGRFEEAQGHYIEAERIAEDASVTEGILVAKAMLAYMSLFQDDVERAAQYERDASAVASTFDLKDQDAWALRAAMHTLTGLLHLAKHELPVARVAFEKALCLATKTGCPKAQLDPIFGKGLVHLVGGEWQTAVDHFMEALDIARDSGWCFAQAMAMEAVAHAYEGGGELYKAIGFHRKALEIFVRIGNRELTDRVIERLAKLKTMDTRGSGDSGIV